MRDITSIYLGTENMSVNLPQNNPLANKKELSYQSLKGKTIISPDNIGLWRQIY